MDVLSIRLCLSVFLGIERKSERKQSQETVWQTFNLLLFSGDNRTAGEDNMLVYSVDSMSLTEAVDWQWTWSETLQDNWGHSLSCQIAIEN